MSVLLSVLPQPESRSGTEHVSILPLLLLCVETGVKIRACTTVPGTRGREFSGVSSHHGASRTRGYTTQPDPKTAPVCKMFRVSLLGAQIDREEERGGEEERNSEGGREDIFDGLV